MNIARHLYKFTVLFHDLQVKVTVEDENDNSPSFDRHIYQGSIRENSPPGTEVILGSVLKVQDPDINDIVTLRVSYLPKQCWMQSFKLIMIH